MNPFPDTSKQPKAKTPRTPREPIPARVFFTFFGAKVTAPKGYGFNGRGDLINATRPRRHRRMT